MKFFDPENKEADYHTKRGVMKLLQKMGIITEDEVPPHWQEYKKNKGGTK